MKLLPLVLIGAIWLATLPAQANDTYRFETVAQRQDMFFETAVRMYAYDRAARGMADQAACATSRLFASPVQVRHLLSELWKYKQNDTAQLLVIALDGFCRDGKVIESEARQWLGSAGSTEGILPEKTLASDLEATLRVLHARAAFDKDVAAAQCIGAKFAELVTVISEPVKSDSSRLLSESFAAVQTLCGFPASPAIAVSQPESAHDIDVARERVLAVRDFAACDAAPDAAAQAKCRTGSIIARLEDIHTALLVHQLRTMPREGLEAMRWSWRLPDGSRIYEVERKGNWMDGKGNPVDPALAATAKPPSALEWADVVAVIRDEEPFKGAAVR